MTRRSPVRRLAGTVLARAVRGRGSRGTEWGEAMLRELAEAETDWRALRWSLSGLRAARRERLANLTPSTGLPRQLRRAIHAGAAVAVAVGGLAVVERFVATVWYQASPAMAPSIDAGDRILVDRLTFRLAGLERGDVVVLTTPAGPQDRSTIKRIVGLPGDQLSCVDGQLFRNGEPVEESYLDPMSVTECAPTLVPEDAVFVMGDARDVSRDSRHYGAVPVSSVSGRVIATISPLT